MLLLKKNHIKKNAPYYAWYFSNSILDQNCNLLLSKGEMVKTQSLQMELPGFWISIKDAL